MRSTTDLVAGQVAFACDLYAALRHEAGNLVFSPYSVHTVLGMAREGAGGRTAQQLDALLRIPDERAALVGALSDWLDPVYGAGRDRQPHGQATDYELDVANRLYADEWVRCREAFLTRIARRDEAGIEHLDLQGDPEGARVRINAWVAERTRGEIPALLPPGSVERDARLLLVNALRFGAAWDTDLEDLCDMPFVRPDGSAVVVPSMFHVASYPYAAFEDVEVATLPYEGRETSMTVVVPRRKDGLPAVEKRLTAGTWASWRDALRSRPASVVLPCFGFGTRRDLAPVLATCGASDAFDPDLADFAPLAELPPDASLSIGAVWHEARVDADERGTRATAATAGLVDFLGAGESSEEESVCVMVDHPFLFAIQHDPSGTLLFLGRVTDPASD